MEMLTQSVKGKEQRWPACFTGVGCFDGLSAGSDEIKLPSFLYPFQKANSPNTMHISKSVLIWHENVFFIPDRASGVNGKHASQQLCSPK
jgi:hypothetical protein